MTEGETHMSNNGDPNQPWPRPDADQAPPPPAGYPGAPQPPYPGAPSAPQPPYAGVPSAPRTGGVPPSNAPQPPYPPHGQYPQPGPYPPPAGAPQPRRPMSPGKKKALLWGLIGGGVLILLILAAVIVVGVMKQQAEQRAAEDEARAISGAVSEYLRALADGDSEAALSHLIEPEPSPLLTDEVLAASNEAAPFADIDVAAVSADDTKDHYGDWDIAATYTIGDDTVDTAFTVSDSGRDEGDYGIMNGLTSIHVPEQLASLDATVNGAKLEGDHAAAFPGSYALELGDDRFTLDGTTSGVVTQPAGSLNLGDGEVALTKDTMKSLRSAVDKAVDTCVSSKKLKAGCGLTMEKKINDGDVTLKDGTLKRSLPSSTKKALKELSFQVSYDDPLTVTSDFIGSIDLEADGKSTSGASGRYELYLGGPMLGSATVDLSSDKPKVSWD